MRDIVLLLVAAAIFQGCSQDPASRLRADRMEIEKTTAWIVHEIQTQAKMPGAPTAWANPQGVKIEYYTRDIGDMEPGWKAVVLKSGAEDVMWIVRAYGDGRPVKVIETISMIPRDQAVRRALPSFKAIDPSRWMGQIPTEAEFMNSAIEYSTLGRSLFVRMPGRGGWGLLTNPDGSINMDPESFFYFREEGLSCQRDVRSAEP